MFVDADDSMPPNAVSVLWENSCGMDIVSGTALIKRNGLLEKFPSHIRERGLFNGDEFLIQLLCGTRLASLWRQLIKQSILSENILSLPKEINIAEDFIINFRLGQYIQKCKGISDVVYYYDFYPTNTVNSIKLSCEYLDFYDNILMENCNECSNIVKSL